jgi:hypothetical protein
VSERCSDLGVHQDSSNAPRGFVTLFFSTPNRSFPEATGDRGRMADAAAAAVSSAQGLLHEVAGGLPDAATLLRCAQQALQTAATFLVDPAAEAAAVAELQRLDSLSFGSVPAHSGSQVPSGGGGVSESKGGEPTSGVVDESALRELQSVIINCTDFSEEETYRTVLSYVSEGGELKGCFPSLCQILWLSSLTPSSSICRFVQRAAAFPTLRFSLVGVNLLTVPAREQLLRAILRPSGRRAQLSLVFTESTGLTSLSLVTQRVNIAKEDILSTRSLRALRGVLSSPDSHLFSTCSLVAGESGSGKSTWIRSRVQRHGGHLVTVALHRGIDVERFSDAYRGAVRAALESTADSGAPEPNAGSQGAVAAPEKPEVVIYFNVSASAVDDSSSRSGDPSAAEVLHGLFTQGLLVDSCSGFVVQLDSRVRHAVYVELPALAEWPSTNSTSFNAAQHPLLKCGFPVFGLASDGHDISIHNESFPFMIDDDARCVAPVLLALLDGTSLEQSLTQPAAQQEDDARTVSLLDALWALPDSSVVPNSKLARHMFIRLFAERVRFLHEIAKHVEKQVADGAVSTLVTTAVRIDGFDANFVPGFFDRIARVMLMECFTLCDRNLKSNFAAENRPLAWTIRNKTELYSFTILTPTLSSLAIETSPIDHASGGLRAGLGLAPPASLMKGLGKLTTTADALEKSASELRRSVAPAFGLSETNRMGPILASRGYVLSKDFAIKLLVLHERKKVGANVILSGDTGTGKSELLGLYSAVINCDVLPDSLFEAQHALVSAILPWGHDPAFAGMIRTETDGRQTIALSGIPERTRFFDCLEQSIPWSKLPGLADQVMSDCHATAGFI